MKLNLRMIVGVAVSLCFAIPPAFSESSPSKSKFVDLGKLKPVDSELKVRSGDLAPDFTLPSISGGKITLSQYRGRNRMGMMKFIRPNIGSAG